jgi:hypothetical protein
VYVAEIAVRRSQVGDAGLLYVARTALSSQLPECVQDWQAPRSVSFWGAAKLMASGSVREGDMSNAAVALLFTYPDRAP